MKCKFCGGTGCLACPGERQRYEQEQTKKALTWKPPTEKTIETAKDVLESFLVAGLISVDEAEKRFNELLMPPPLFVAKLGNETDIDLLKTFASASMVEKLYSESGGNLDKFLTEFAKLAESARVKQAEQNKSTKGNE